MSEVSLKIGDSDDKGDKKSFAHRTILYIAWACFLVPALPIAALMVDTITGNEDDGLFLLVYSYYQGARDQVVDWRMQSKHDRLDAEEPQQVELDKNGRLYVKESYTEEELEAYRIWREEIMSNPEYGDTEQERYDRLLREGFEKEHLDWLREMNGGELRPLKGPPEEPRTKSEIEAIIRGDLPEDYKMPGSDTDPSNSNGVSKNGFFSWLPWNKSPTSDEPVIQGKVPIGGFVEFSEVGRERFTKEYVRELFRDHTDNDSGSGKINLDDGDGRYLGPHYKADNPDCVVDPNSYGLPACLGFD